MFAISLFLYALWNTLNGIHARFVWGYPISRKVPFRIDFRFVLRLKIHLRLGTQTLICMSITQLASTMCTQSKVSNNNIINWS